MQILSYIVLAILVSLVPTAVLGVVCHRQSWFHHLNSADRQWLILTAWAICALVFFTWIAQMPSMIYLH